MVMPDPLSFVEGLFLGGKCFGIGMVMWAGWRIYSIVAYT